MANELDETRDVVNPQGRDTGVIEKQLPIKNKRRGGAIRGRKGSSDN